MRVNLYKGFISLDLFVPNEKPKAMFWILRHEDESYIGCGTGESTNSCENILDLVVEPTRRSDKLRAQQKSYNDIIFTVNLDALMLEHGEHATYKHTTTNPYSNKWLGVIKS